MNQEIKEANENNALINISDENFKENEVTWKIMRKKESSSSPINILIKKKYRIVVNKIIHLKKMA